MNNTSLTSRNSSTLLQEFQHTTAAKAFVMFAVLLSSTLGARATIIQQIGNYENWGTVTWNAIEGLDDADDGVSGELEFVGNSTTRGAYWGIDNDYIYFRMRLGADTDPSFSGAHLILLDVAGDERITDGYVQTTDNVGSDSDPFGKTTFLDFAVSLSYLSNYVPVLVENSDWNVQFGSIDNATDHNVLSADVAGGQTLDSSITADSWGTIAIPEPAAVTLIIGFGISMLFVRRIFEE